MHSNEKLFGIFANCVVAALLVIAAVNFYQARHAPEPTRLLSYSEFLDDLDKGTVRSVVLTGQDIQGSLSDKTRFRSYGPSDSDLVRTLRQKGVAITVLEAPANGPSWVGIVSSLFPTVLLIVLRSSSCAARREWVAAPVASAGREPSASRPQPVA